MPSFRLLAMTLMAGRATTRSPGAARPPRPARRPRQPSPSCTLELSGRAVRRGEAYFLTFFAREDALAISRLGDMDRAQGELPVHVVVRDAAGAVVKERDRDCHLLVRLQAPGDGNWRLESRGKAPAGMPRIAIKGNLAAVNESVCTLEGTGRLSFKKTGAKKATTVRVEVRGIFSKEEPERFR